MIFGSNFFYKPYDQKCKLIVFGVSLFLITGSYTLLKELKDAVFMIIVGVKYLPDAKILSLIFAIPLIFFYGWLFDRVSRYKVLLYCLFYAGIGGGGIAYFINHPVIGLQNTVSSSSRLFGWFFFIFLEGCYPLVVSAIWSLWNSISYPEDIKDSYVSMTAMSRLGAIFFSGLAYLYNVYWLTEGIVNEVFQYFLIMLISSVSLLLIPFLFIFLVKNNSGEFLKGYSAEMDQKEKTEDNNKNFFSIFKCIKNFYIIGIFGLTFFWEIINVIFNNLRLNIAFSEATSMCGITAVLYKNIFFMQVSGLFFTFFGTKNIFSRLGIRPALILIPSIIGGMIFLFLMFPSSQMILFVYLVIRVVHYTLTFPIREALFIPTNKDIQFKTKAWIDSFGQKFSKGCGSFLIKVIHRLSAENIHGIQIIFFGVLIIFWGISDYFLGKKWEKTIENKEIIT